MRWKNWHAWLKGGIILSIIVLIISLVPIMHEFLGLKICYNKVVNIGQGDFVPSDSPFCNNVWFPFLWLYFHDPYIIFHAFIVGALLGAITGSILKLTNQNNNYKKVWPLWLVAGWIFLVIINIWSFSFCESFGTDTKCLQHTIVSNFTNFTGLGVDMRFVSFLFFLVGAFIGVIISWIYGKIKQKKEAIK